MSKELTNLILSKLRSGMPINQVLQDLVEATKELEHAYKYIQAIHESNYAP